MDKVLKQRLIGATILIALAVIFVPMLFDEGPEREQLRDTAIELPPPPVDRREVRRLPLNPEQVREAPATVAPAPEPLLPDPAERDMALFEATPELDELPPVQPDDSIRLVEDAADSLPLAAAPPERAPEPMVAAPAPVMPAPAPAPATPSVPAPAVPASAGGSWVVQVASFSSADTADRVVEQLGRLGHSAMVDVIVRGDSRLYRVRTGPYASRAEGDRAQAQIAGAVRGVDPVVMSAPAGSGGSAAPAARSAATAGTAFSVQVGSFTTRPNADRLSEQLRAAGFDAFLHPDETGSRPIWRVRVGTLANRDEATSLRRRLLDEAGLEGMVVSHP